jgi:hypothetical protein
VIRRAFASLALAGILVIGLAPAAAADTFGSLTGDELTAEVQFSRWHDGSRQDWFVFAVRDRLAGTTTVDATYNSERSITCRDGSDGSVLSSFFAIAPGSLVVGRTLGAAAGAVRLRGTQDTYNSCTDRLSSISKSFVVSFAIVATSPLSTDTLTQDVLWDDGICYLLTQHFESRGAHGAAVVNGHVFGTSAAGIGHHHWDSVAQDASACDVPPED